MPDFLTTPANFTAARRYLADKVNLPTTLGSLDISNKLPAQIRGQAFFSARVASANILQAMRTEVEAIARGDYNYAEGRLRLKEFLAKQGYGVPNPDEAGDKSLKNLASTRRLDLVLRQNVAMAHAIGQRAVAEHPDVLEYLPNYEYVAVMDGHTRDEHAALNGLVLPKKDPFWNTHFPPWEFNCRCLALDTFAPVNGRSSGFGSDPTRGAVQHGNTTHNIAPNASGFEFRSDPSAAFKEPDFASIQDADMRAAVEAAWQARGFAQPPPAATPAVPLPQHAPKPKPQKRWKLPAGLKHFAAATPQAIMDLVDIAPTFFITRSSYKAFYRTFSASVHMNKNKSTWAGTEYVYHHEVGHHLHHRLKVVTVSGVDRKFEQAMQKDFGELPGKKFGTRSFGDLSSNKKQSAIMADYAKAHGISPYLPQADVLTAQRVLALFDTIGGMTRGTHGWGHKVSYYKTGNKAAMEAFANCSAAHIMGWPEFSVYFPNTMKYIEKKLGPVS